MYQKTVGLRQYYVTNKTVSLPDPNFDVHYVPNYGTADNWSAAALQAYLNSGLIIYGGEVTVSFPTLDYAVTNSGSNRVNMDKRGVFVSGSDTF